MDRSDREAANILANMGNFVPTQQPTQTPPSFYVAPTNEGASNPLSLHFKPLNLPIKITAQEGGINSKMIQTAKILADIKYQSHRHK
tara:strand:+ start:2135 stop:2395 length:261 start_codon:yes stop_codon:yes gene_type:complete